jgi:hypothetical protein
MRAAVHYKPRIGPSYKRRYISNVSNCRTWWRMRRRNSLPANGAGAAYGDAWGEHAHGATPLDSDEATGLIPPHFTTQGELNERLFGSSNRLIGEPAFASCFPECQRSGIECNPTLLTLGIFQSFKRLPKFLPKGFTFRFNDALPMVRGFV